jgi:hypothetical protein
MFRNHRSQARNAERKQREKATEHVTGIFNEIITADIAAAYPYDRRVRLTSRVLTSIQDSM